MSGAEPLTACYYLSGFKEGQGAEPERLQAYADLEGIGRVEFDLAVAPDGSTSGVGRLPDGRETLISTPSHLELDKADGLCGVSISGTAKAVEDARLVKHPSADEIDPCLECPVVPVGREECRTAHHDTLCPEEQGKRGEA